MDFLTYSDIIKNLSIGKKLPDSVYIHKSAVDNLPETLVALISSTAKQFDISNNDWSIIKLYKKDYKITYLNYPDFDDISYPALKFSQIVNLDKQTTRKSNYSKSENPPILHRKETFVTDNYPLISLFKAITQEGEKIGLYEKTSRIGFKKNWEKLIKSKGYYLDNEGRLKPLTEKPISKSQTTNFTRAVERHKTAINRNQLSQPMQVLARHNYLNGEYSVLDYGCGKGDDVRELEAHGINVTGWDPVHRPNVKYTQHDLVNLGFVLNVIEDRKERTQTLLKAWKYSGKAIVIAVMVAGESVISQFKPYKDGIITSRNTFQKYYSQGEIRYYIESTLDEKAIAVGQGIFLVFKDKIEEQTFLSERQHIKRNWKQKTQRQLALKPKKIRKDVIDKNSELFNDYWETTLELGRLPANNEFEFSEQIRRLCGSHNKAHQALLKHFGEDVFEESCTKRKEDLLVYFALSLFERRKPQSKMPESLKRDIKAFFPSYSQALEQSKELLFSVGNPITIDNACKIAHEQLDSGYMEEGHSFTFHRKYLGELPAELRIYTACATQLYGDIDEFELIKAHIRSGKVSLMRYDNWEKDEPLLLERVKIKLRELDIDFFDYSGEFEPVALLNKVNF
ncbi:MAG TPA: DNA phosphorothioation-associated putative methyltransferase [Leucothrix mucor]|uniref:DNA phosphorothioation-associated putative methyltransferase n=1 Tax=Leucothrix mucor TaxID=45248 RepID=A0A7V2T274_LEUMU|nr:DNA phosphorothioation-associated putative methyltransferase [Leucothrix mucor]